MKWNIKSKVGGSSETWGAARGGCVLVVLAAAGCGFLEVQEKEPQSSTAVRAEMTVKEALLEAEGVAAAPVRVEYEEGTVRLSGFVESEEERRRVEEIARQALPDLEIINGLEVWKS